MPLLAIREVLTGEFNDWTAEADGETKICQKRINLDEGYRYRVKNVQVFDDKGGIIAADSSDSVPAIMQLTYVTPYPIILTSESQGLTLTQRGVFLQSGPFAADNSVLYKSLEFNTNFEDSPIQISNQLYKEEFPSPALEQLNAQVWYSPHLYLTLIQAWGGEGVDNSVAKSFYVELEKTKCSALERSIGCYKEYLEAQARLLTVTANFIDPSSQAAGRSFPSWLYGGMRAELMLNANNTLRYFNNTASRDYQIMIGQSAYEQRFRWASTMVEFDKPFGYDPSSGNAYPDWLAVDNVAGITSGPIRPFPPPSKFTGNGNTVMYDNDGNPASTVT